MYLNEVLDKSARKLTFHERLNHLIELRGVSKQWLATKLGISKQALNYLLNHAVKPKYIDEFAEYLNANPAWIETGEGPPLLSHAMAPHDMAQVPIYTKHNILDSDASAAEKLTYSTTTPEQMFAYRLEDDSLFPPFMKRTILIFDNNKKPKPLDYVIMLDHANHLVHIAVYEEAPKQDTWTMAGVLVEARYIP